MKRDLLKIAIIGAGFAGLSLTFHLVSSGKAECTLFDQTGIGGGASGIASGLLHPFPAAATQYSFMGKEALHESMKLLNVASKYAQTPVMSSPGIFKLAMSSEDTRRFSALSHRYERLKWFLSHPITANKSFPSLLIENGVTVFCQHYLESLWAACSDHGASFVKEKIEDVSALKGFDVAILCVGAGIHELDPAWKLQFIKGQVLECKAKEPLLKCSVIAKGYVAVTEDPLVYHVGSTYEHRYTQIEPDMDTAKELILPKCKEYFSAIDQMEITDCRAAVRVANPSSHLPVIKRCSASLYAVSGLGSRGLLYHGLLGKQLTEALLLQDTKRISREFFLDGTYT